MFTTSLTSPEQTVKDAIKSAVQPQRSARSHLHLRPANVTHIFEKKKALRQAGPFGTTKQCKERRSSNTTQLCCIVVRIERLRTAEKIFGGRLLIPAGRAKRRPSATSVAETSVGEVFRFKEAQRRICTGRDIAQRPPPRFDSLPRLPTSFSCARAPPSLPR